MFKDSKKHQNSVSDVFLMFLLLTMLIPFSSVSILNFEQANVSGFCLMSVVILKIGYNDGLKHLEH